jgi:hypothetical protein
MYVVKETACLTVADRSAVDEELAADTGTFTGAGTRTVIAAVRTAATLARRRANIPVQRRGTLRSLQPHQGTPRMESKSQNQVAARIRTDHTHRPQLPLNGTAATRIQSARYGVE